MTIRPSRAGLRVGALLLPLLLSLGGCDLLSSDPEPQEIELSRARIEFDAVGDTATVEATVFDDEGQEMVGREVAWSSSDPSVATVTPQGRVTSVGAGAAQLRAESGDAFAEVSVTVTPRATVLESVTQDPLVGTAGEPLATPITVRALDRLGNPVVGLALMVRVDFGGGSVDASTITTGSDGRASVTWTLGVVAGEAQQLSIASTTNLTRFFTATAQAGPPAVVRVLAGEGQAGLPGTPLPVPLRVRLEDRVGNALAGRELTFEVVEGGGALTVGQGTTDDDGEVSTNWTLGPQEGVQRVRAALPGGPESSFEATAVVGPHRLVLVSGDGAVGTVGEVLGIQPVVRLEDVSGNGIPGLPVLFQAGNEGGLPGPSTASVLTDENGEASPGSWTLGPLAGSQVLSASFPGLDPVQVTVTAQPGDATELEVVTGGYQSVRAGDPLPDPVVVAARDRFGNPVAGALVSVATTAGGGAVDQPVATTGAEGTAALMWTLGDAVGLQTLTLDLGIGDDPFEVHAAGLYENGGEFSVTYIYTTVPAPEIWAAFEVAGSRWAQIIVGDLPDVNVDLPVGDCGTRSRAFSGTIDDVLIFASVEPIDGEFQILGQARPCRVREGSLLPFTGLMRFDVADLLRLERGGTLGDLILHEIGHVLGIGSLWDDMGLLEDPSLQSQGSSPDTHFTGAQAVAAFDQIGGETYTGAKVPVENNEGGAGTQDAHWRESIFDDELMTGFLSNSGNPLSVVTAASLADQGYTVSLDLADPYQLSLPTARLPGDEAPRADLIPLLDDVIRVPVRIGTGR